MRNFELVLYGIIVGNWLMGGKERLFPGSAAGRYAVVGMHCNKNEFILVGRCSSSILAEKVADYVEDNAMCYIGLFYDLMDPGDKNEFSSHVYTEDVESEDQLVIAEARGYLTCHDP